MSSATKKGNGAGKLAAVQRYGLTRVKTASEIRKALNLKRPQSYKIHQLLAVPAGR